MKLRILYRGHMPGPYCPAWAIDCDAPAMFATRDPELAAQHDRRVERIEIDHINARVLKHGTAAFRALDGRASARTPRQRVERIIDLARGTWDVVWFREPDVGVAILEPRVIVDLGEMTL